MDFKKTIPDTEMKTERYELMIVPDAAPVTVFLPDARIDYANHLHGQVQQMAVRTWQMAVVLGHTLRTIKDQCKHGEWGKLFKNSRSKSNAKLISHFNFGEKQAGNYMAVYDAAVEAAKRISEERAAAVMQMLATRPGQDFYLALGEISQASTIKEFLAEVVDDSESRGAKHSKANMRDAMEEAMERQVAGEREAQEDAAKLLAAAEAYRDCRAGLCTREFNGLFASQMRNILRGLETEGRA
ncbi:Hypothetical protein PYTT_1363 [Akkermansia glycaniphila]|uniref:Uncharacterized protein n=2 Tax=Akkermansia glycaniphila TaxID=1679444 RepID=A0A1C7PF61_9BACT|nr:hypothetical protein AC781_10735 [Akkermansia glycaniphila]OCA04216.1 hypothetical protein AC781_00540 [Akkermansia glycaniphila]SEH87331.1 Hypothetical protein PYTT_1363 [Akkermansia glycaniphila]